MDILFERKVSAGKFRSTDVSPWSAEVEEIERVESDEKHGAQMIEKI